MRRLLPLLLIMLLLLSQAAFAGGEFDTRQYPNRLTGAHTTVFFTTKGPDGVDEQYARQVLDLTERAYDRLVTKGGLRPPRTLPIPVVIQSDSPSLGGEVSDGDLGHGYYVRINKDMDPQFALGDVIAHELFHVLQAAYNKGGPRPDWAIEGTAPVAVVYAYDQKEKSTLDQAMRGHLSGYWTVYANSFKDHPYDPSLFWYVTAERYGGLKYLDRLLTWAEDVEWERAAQLAAIQGGAPGDTTWDSLWRTFAFDLVAGRLPAGYKSENWFNPIRVGWNGEPQSLTHREAQGGVTKLGKGFAYRQPLVLPPYSFELVDIIHSVDQPFEVTVTGDKGSVSAYLIKPGPKLTEALHDPEQRPGPFNFQAPPADGDLPAARLTFGEPVRIDATRKERTLLLIMRLGNWGPGSFQVSLKPAADGTPAPKLAPLHSLPQDPASAMSPPALTASELEALKKGAWLTGVVPLEQDKSVAGKIFRTVEFTIGESTAWDGQREVKLPFPVVQDEAYNVWIPLRPFVEMLGGRMQGNRVTLGDQWWQLTPGSHDVESSEGSYYIAEVPWVQNGELVVESTFLNYLGAQYMQRGEDHWVTYPNPTPPPPVIEVWE